MPEISKICSHCGIEVRNLSQHIKNVHEENETPCEICNKMFKSVMLKVRHVNKTHGSSITCLICEITFPSNAYLQAHGKRVHSIDKTQYSCLYCDKQFSSKQYLIQHNQQFCSDKFSFKLKCIHCEKYFKKKTALNEHTKSHEAINKNFIKEKCQICGNEIMHKNMKAHLFRCSVNHEDKVESDRVEVDN